MGLQEVFGFEFQCTDELGPATAYINSLNETTFEAMPVSIGLIVDSVIEEINGRETPKAEETASNGNDNPKQSNPKDFGEWDMVFVKGGAFTATLGDTDENRREIVIRKNVKIADFYIGRYPVTRSQWFSVMEDKTCEADGKLPIECVSWEMAQAFIGKLNKKTGKNFRLPTAAEWEYAATGGQQSKGYKFSGSNDADKVAWYADNSGYKVHEVGTKEPNELEIYDMSGNVWEWCSDRWGNYQNLPTFNGQEALNMMLAVLSRTRQPDDPLIKEIKEKQKAGTAIAEGAYRVRRGCFWGNPTPYVHDSIRFTEVPNDTHGGNGFRLAHSVNK
jgi:formylglycine-generating enzyme required for sulfatase activity